VPPNARELASGPCTGAVDQRQAPARAAATASVSCGLLHGLQLTGSPAGWWSAGVHLGLVLACLPCAVHLWRRPGPLAWGVHGVLAVLMAVAHPLAMAVGAAGPHAHMVMPVTGLPAAAGEGAPVLALISLGIAAVAVAGGALRPQR
jgi:hypothetical protein